MKKWQKKLRRKSLSEGIKTLKKVLKKIIKKEKDKQRKLKQILLILVETKWMLNFMTLTLHHHQPWQLCMSCLKCFLFCVWFVTCFLVCCQFGRWQSKKKDLTDPPMNKKKRKLLKIRKKKKKNAKHVEERSQNVKKVWQAVYFLVFFCRLVELSTSSKSSHITTEKNT